MFRIRLFLSCLLALFFFYPQYSVEALCTTEPAGAVASWSGDSTLVDSINGNNGSIVGGVTYGTGHKNSAFVFDGTTGYIDVPDSSSLHLGANDFSISLWFKYTANGTEQLLIDKEGTAPNFPDYAVGVTSAGRLRGYAVHCGTGSCGFGSSFHWIDGTATVSQNAWHHVTFVRTGGAQKLYLDGTLDSTLNEGPWNTDSTQNLYIGAARSGLGGGIYFTNGSIDEIKIFNRALTNEEIQGLYTDNLCSLSINAIVSEALIMTLNNNTVQFHLDPSVNGGDDKSQYTTITTATNATNGYKIYGKLDNGNGQARLGTGTSYISSGTGENTISFDGVNAAYNAGHTVNTDAAFSSTSTILNSNAADIGLSGPTNSQNHTVYYDVNVDYTMPAGVYNGTITYTAIGSF